MTPSIFIIKHTYNKLPQNTIVKYITCINMYCLVEDINTKKREWVAKWDIYPINDHDIYGYWKYDITYQNRYLNTIS